MRETVTPPAISAQSKDVAPEDKPGTSVPSTTAAGKGTQAWQVRCRRQFRKLWSIRSSFRNKAGHASLSTIVDIPPLCVSTAFFCITAGAVGCGVPPSGR